MEDTREALRGRDSEERGLPVTTSSDAEKPLMCFDHIGIAVFDLVTGRDIFEAAFLIDRWTGAFDDPINDVRVQFGVDPDGICYELIAPLSAKSPIQRSLRSGNNITNHVAYRVVDLVAARDRLLTAGFSPVNEARPAVAYNGADIQFFMSPLSSLVELIEAPDHEHQYILTVHRPAIA